MYLPWTNQVARPSRNGSVVFERQGLLIVTCRILKKLHNWLKYGQGESQSDTVGISSGLGGSMDTKFSRALSSKKPPKTCPSPSPASHNVDTEAVFPRTRSGAVIQRIRRKISKKLTVSGSSDNLAVEVSSGQQANSDGRYSSEKRLDLNPSQAFDADAASSVAAEEAASDITLSTTGRDSETEETGGARSSRDYPASDTTASSSNVSLVPAPPAKSVVIRMPGLSGPRAQTNEEQETELSAVAGTQTQALLCLEGQFWAGKAESNGADQVENTPHQAPEVADFSLAAPTDRTTLRDITLLPINGLLSQLADQRRLIILLRLRKFNVSLNEIDAMIDWISYLRTFLRGYFDIVDTCLMPMLSPTANEEFDQARLADTKDSSLSSLSQLLLKFENSANVRAPGEHLSLIVEVADAISPRLLALARALESEMDLKNELGGTDELEEKMLNTLREKGNEGIQGFVVMSRWMRYDKAAYKRVEKMFLRKGGLALKLAKAKKAYSALEAVKWLS